MPEAGRPELEQVVETPAVVPDATTVALEPAKSAPIAIPYGARSPEGLGGMRDFNGQLSFAPRLPSRINRLEFSLLWHGLRLRVSVTMLSRGSCAIAPVKLRLRRKGWLDLLKWNGWTACVKISTVTVARSRG